MFFRDEKRVTVEVAGTAPPQAARRRPPMAICRSGNRSRKAAGHPVAVGHGNGGSAA
ncbi:hypothetical protein [Streptomyces atriruber]|uniref:hypothetical protein n=1 Tax=Streptomyces atriruber TaxID=545121 RepID=UPI0012FE84B6|nr:hypothetical protein [Streptomyces atriruber]